MFANTLKTRVLIALSALSLTPLVLIGLHGYFLARQAVLEQAREHITSTVRARHAMITSWLVERNQDINALAHLPILTRHMEGIEHVEDADARLLEDLLESTRAAGYPYESLSIYDRHWAVLARVRGESHSEEEFLTETFKTGVATAENVYFDIAHVHDRRQVGTHFGLAIRTEAHRVLGYLVANLNLTESLTPLLTDRSGLAKTGKAYIISDDLEVLTEPFTSGERVSFLRRAHPMLLENPNDLGKSVRQYPDFFGHMVLGTSMKLPLQGWKVVVEIDAKEVRKWESILLTRVTVALLIAIVAIVLASFWLSHALGRPLASLAAVAHRIISGDTGQRMGKMGMREADEVRLAFNQMLDQLQTKEQEIVNAATMATIGELTSRIVHEMRNPLSSIKVNLQTIREAAKRDRDCHELTEIALGQTERLEKMLHELLQFGKPLQLAPEEIAFKQVIARAVQGVSGLAMEKGVHIRVNDGLGTKKIYVDCEHFTRALTNLLQNAIEATRAGTEVLVEARESSRPGEYVEIAVYDYGPGISGEYRERLFTPFFTTKPRGIGLGLANVRKFVQQHGGAVVMTERPEGGAIFLIRIPASKRLD